MQSACKYSYSASQQNFAFEVAEKFAQSQIIYNLIPFLIILESTQVSIRSICLSEDRIILNNTESDP
jgi:hypothetical protein